MEGGNKMTREEQIQKLIDEENGIDSYGSSDYQIGVYDGVRLADKTMIDKACEYLESSLKHDLGYYGVADFVNTFRKAMEE